MQVNAYSNNYHFCTHSWLIQITTTIRNKNVLLNINVYAAGPTCAQTMLW